MGSHTWALRFLGISEIYYELIWKDPIFQHPYSCVHFCSFLFIQRPRNYRCTHCIDSPSILDTFLCGTAGRATSFPLRTLEVCSTRLGLSRKLNPIDENTVSFVLMIDTQQHNTTPTEQWNAAITPQSNKTAQRHHAGAREKATTTNLPPPHTHTPTVGTHLAKSTSLAQAQRLTKHTTTRSGGATI
jgi:hypothetical protein